MPVHFVQRVFPVAWPPVEQSRHPILPVPAQTSHVLAVLWPPLDVPPLAGAFFSIRASRYSIRAFCHGSVARRAAVW